MTEFRQRFSPCLPRRSLRASFANSAFAPMLRAMALVAALATTAWSASGCYIGLDRDDDDRPASCSPANCDGCCINGVCRPGNTIQACGSDGLGCVRCLDDEVCEEGRCRIDFAPCGPGNCAGCCKANECVTGTTALSCGASGASCDTCESGEACVAGACVPSNADCGPQTCAGCCRLGVCESGANVNACGFGGGACTTCTGGDVCRSGECKEPPTGTCSPATCNGCCRDGVCEPGVAADACGRFGATCIECTGALTCREGGCAQPGNVGDKCSGGEECDGGYCSTSAPGGGYCLAACIPEACPNGSTCVQLGDEEGDTWCMDSCLTNGDCRAEHHCVPLEGGGGVCFPRCTSDSHCSSGVCDRSSGECVLGVVGTGCGADVDCGDGYFCATNTPGGYCSRLCDHTRPCPAGSDCISQGSSSVCLATCDGPADCRNSDYLCHEGHCLPACQSDDDCPIRNVCDTGSGMCVEGGPSGGVVGAACGSDHDCDYGDCLTEAETDFPDGYCTGNCAGSLSCPSGAFCAEFGETSDPDYFAMCLDLCESDDECRSDYVCYGASEEYYGFCFPSCTTFDYCDATEVCEETSGRCIDAPTGGSGITIERLSRPSVSIPVMQYSADVEVTVPADAISLTLSVDGGADASFFLARVTGPDGSEWYSSSGGFGKSRLRPYSWTMGGSQVTYIPNTPNLSLPPGKYRFSYAADSRSEVGWPVALLKKSASGTVQSGALDVNFVFVGHPTLTATAAQTNASFQSLVTTFRSRLGEAGITVGDIDYFDLESEVFRFASLDKADLGALMRKSTTLPDDRLNVFWVREVRDGGLSGGGIILGVSAGIPGAPIRGSGNSGVAMALGDFPGFGWSATDVAGTLVHEVGHWMGLFHTTESNGQSFDVLSDTPECTTARDTNGDGVLSASECEFYGGTNVMFWSSSYSLEQTVLTPNQRFVMLRHPAVR